MRSITSSANKEKVILPSLKLHELQGIVARTPRRPENGVSPNGSIGESYIVPGWHPNPKIQPWLIL